MRNAKQSEKVRKSNTGMASMVMVSVLAMLLAFVGGIYLGYQSGFAGGTDATEARWAKVITSEAASVTEDGSLNGLADALEAKASLNRLLPERFRSSKSPVVPYGLYRKDPTRDWTVEEVATYVRNVQRGREKGIVIGVARDEWSDE